LVLENCLKIVNWYLKIFSDHVNINDMKLTTTLLLTFLLCSCTGETTPSSPTPEVTPPTPQAQETDTELLSGTHTVSLNTSLGKMTLELDADKAPKTVTNFVTHAQNGYYDDLTFHRVIKGFMIQGGDPRGNGTGGESIWGTDFEDEINDLPMSRGAIAMANRGPNTNGSQFFIVHAEETPWLVGKHTVFGNVTEGMDVLDAIADLETDGRDVPVEAVTFSAEAID